MLDFIEIHTHSKSVYAKSLIKVSANLSCDAMLCLALLHLNHDHVLSCHNILNCKIAQNFLSSSTFSASYIPSGFARCFNLFILFMFLKECGFPTLFISGPVAQFFLAWLCLISLHKVVHFTTRGHLFFKISRFISDVA